MPFKDIIGNMLTKIISVLTTLQTSYNEDTATDGLRQCTKASRHIRHRIKNVSTVGEKQHLLTLLANVKSLCRQIKYSKKHGSGIASEVRKETARDRVRWDDSETAFASRIRTGVITNLKHKDTCDFLGDSKMLFIRRIKHALKNEESLKVNMVFGGEFILAKADKMQTDIKYFTTPNSAIYKDTNLDEWFEKYVTRPILNELEEFQLRGSGWTLSKIINLGVNINKFTPQLGSSYIELPIAIKKRQACINVKNSDNRCFIWSILSALYPVERGNHSDRPSSYQPHLKELNLKDIVFPMTIKQIPRFEKQNNISINVYILKKSSQSFVVMPTYLTKHKTEKHVNLLLIQNKYYTEDNEEENDDGTPVNYHYVWIKDLSRLLSKQLSHHNGRKLFCDKCCRYFYSKIKLNQHTINCMGTNNNTKIIFCDRCLNRFATQNLLESHIEECKLMNTCAIRMPKDHEKFIQFKNFKNKEKVAYVIYADTESVLEPIKDNNRYQRHVPAVIGYYVKCSYDDSLSFYRSYRGKDCMEWFANELKQFAEDVETVFQCPYNIDPLTPQQQLEFDNATQCHICTLPFTTDDKKVRDHFHLASGRNNGNAISNYRGPAHESCNINFKDSRDIPVVFHNLQYDGTLLIEKIASMKGGKVSLLPVTKEKYISFTKYIEDCDIKFRFIDSFRFLASSLDNLASNLTDYPLLRQEFKDLSEEQFNLLTTKGVYPYDYISNFDKFNESQLPPIEQFYNRLEDKKCSRKQYLRAQLVWNKFNIKNLGQYTELYMKADIILLMEIVEQFRARCYKTYGLDALQYYTLPGYAWDCMLYKTGQKLELLTDIDQLLFVERAIRGGLSQCSKRRAKANNKYLPNYDTSKPDVQIHHHDINNQYGWAQSNFLPYGGFKWVENVHNFDVTTIPNNSPVGYFLEVDLHYPKALHDKHSQLPFCPEKCKPPGSKDEKLLATLHDKKKYVLHYRNLKQALVHGLQLTKIHRILQFQQAAWLRCYIELNTELRTNAKNDFDKNLFKLMNNAVFGKTMENIRKHSNVKLVTKWEGRYGAEALISKPEFKSSTIFNDKLVAIELNKTEIFFNKPIYIGMAILDIAKTTIYDYHYGYIQRLFGDDCSVLYTDTDSLIFEVRNHDLYDVIRKDCHQYFDTSDYPPDNRYGIPLVNKKVLGLMKDETHGVPITDFIGLRSKMYTIKKLVTEEDIEMKRAKLYNEGYDDFEIDNVLLNIGLTKKIKGVKTNVVRTRITFNDYVDCIENLNKKMIDQKMIKMEKYKIYSIEQKKLALSPYDDKRYLIRNSYDTLPWGHYSVMDTCE